MVINNNVLNWFNFLLLYNFRIKGRVKIIILFDFIKADSIYIENFELVHCM